MKIRRYFSRKTVHATAAILFVAGNGLATVNADMETRATIGMGFDDNIYKTPNGDYFDINSANPVDANGNNIHVIKSGGAFIPYDVKVSGSHLTAPDIFFIGEYKLKGYRYLNGDYSNANRTDNKFSVGVMRQFNKEGVREENLEGNILFGHQNRLYLDRDTGQNHIYTTGNPADVATRYIYDYTGFEIAYKDRVSPLQKKASLHLEKRDYQDVPGVPEKQYDNTYTKVIFGIDKKLDKNLKLGVDYQYYTYNFVERKARDANGTLNGPPRKYTYSYLLTALRYRMNKDWLHVFHLGYKTRKDAYVGYDDYSRISYGFKSQWDMNSFNRLELALDLWKRDYSKAFAFDDPTQEKKAYDGSTLELSYTRKLNEQMDVVGSYTNIDENSTDTRYQYVKRLYMVTLQYKLD